MRSASRTGTRLVSSRAAMSSCRIRSPGRRSPPRIASRRYDATRALLTSVGSAIRVVRALVVPGLAVGVGDQLELHPPRAEEVDPPVAEGRTAAGGRAVEDPHPGAAQVGDRGVEVV